MSESIKTAIENESYASVAPIRELSHTLHHSIGRGISIIEQARQILASFIPGDVDLENSIDIEALRALASRSADDWVDVRNWELFPAYVGLAEKNEGAVQDPEVAGRNLLALHRESREDEEGGGGGREVDGAWCAAWADVLRRIVDLGAAATTDERRSDKVVTLPSSVS